MLEKQRPTLSLKPPKAEDLQSPEPIAQEATPKDQNGAASASSDYSATDPSDLIAARLAAREQEEGGAEKTVAGAPVGDAQAEYLSPEEWAAFFCLPFAAARVIVAARARIDLESLAITPKTPGVSDAARAAFDLCKSVPWLHALTRRENSALANGIVVVAFVGNVAQTAHAEFVAKMRAPATMEGGAPHPDDMARAA